MIKSHKVLYVCILTLFLTSCSAPYVSPEYSFPEQKIDRAAANKSMSKLVIFNNSNPLINGKTKIKITLDNKIVGQLHLKEFLILDIKKGSHRLKLEHKDVLTFRSSHIISVNNEQEFLQIVATIASNTAKIVHKPDDFIKTYDQAYAATKK